LVSLGLAELINDMGFQLEFNSLTHLVQKLTSYEQRYPDIYQDKFKRQITLVDTEDTEDSEEEKRCLSQNGLGGGGGQTQCLANSYGTRVARETILQVTSLIHPHHQ
jgi:t-SNARE complex subunit (syntaxin)